MKVQIQLVLLTLSSQSLMAEPAWHDYDGTDHVLHKTDFDGAVVEIGRRDVQNAAFKEDNLNLSFSGAGSGKFEIAFTSSYEIGAVAMEGRLLFLRCGIGRGTCAREEHVRIYLVGRGDCLDELADVKVSSFMVPSDGGVEDPIQVEYSMNVRNDQTGTTITFSPPSIKGVSMPEKVVRIALKGVQDASGQPAARRESKPEGGDKPQPKSEEHSR